MDSRHAVLVTEEVVVVEVEVDPRVVTSQEIVELGLEVVTADTTNTKTG
jgi:hypothetical protein